MESMVVFYPCLSIQKTTHFYNQILNLKIYSQDLKSIIFDTGYGYLGFVQYEDPTLATKTCISFNLESQEAVDKMYHHLRQYDVEFTSKPEKHKVFQVYSFFMKDPNGYNVEFQKILK